MLYFEKWKIVLIYLLCALGIVYAAPNMLPVKWFEGLPGWMPGKRMSLGLDLRGGSHLLLEVEVSSVLRERLESLVDAARASLRQARIGYEGLALEGQAVTLTVRDAAQIEGTRTLLRELDRDGEVVVAGNRLTFRLTERAMQERRRSAVDQSIEIVRRRVDETGTREPIIQRQGETRILVQVPGLDDPERLKEIIGKTAKMTFHLLDDNASLQEARSGRLPAGTMLVTGDAKLGEGGREYLVQRRVRVSGDALTDAQPTFQDGRPVVNFNFDAQGARRFGDATKENVGKSLAIVLDGKVVSAPVIREPILGGRGIISGSFTVQQANDLALVLRAGALPAPLNILEERTVGPGLGADSIAAGEFASIVAIILVVLFMVVIYGLFGIFANIALAFNLAILVALMSALQATLTLPGIAGIVLTLGMAVDANVLIYERMREEVRLGRTPISAADAGYRGAMTAIVDSNLTTLIAGGLLYHFGTGPVRGFAVTLSLGIITSMFTAILLTRYIVAAWIRYARPQSLPI
jgi:preprotein translocase subunit SecD